MSAKGISQHGLETSLKNWAFAMILILFVILSMLSWYKQMAISEFSEVNQLTSISINY